jgi:restriction modification system DNA specificity domain protein
VAEVTNYIDRLVAELCPDGVEYRPLGDVVEKNYGGGTPSKAKEEYWGGDIPWASVGDLSNDLMEILDTRSKITPAGVSGSSTNVVPAGAVIVAIKIAPGKMKIAGVDLAINQDIRGLVLNDLMNARFLTYYFRTLRFAGHGTIVKSITNKRLMDTEVPVPPMEIQEAIVEILDKFTNLEAELEAELEARTLQYEYYRSSLFNTLRNPETGVPTIAGLVKELCPEGVEYRPLGEIADIGTGKSDKKDAQESGQYPFYVRSKTILRSSKYLYDETAIVIPGEGGVGEIFHFVSGKYDLHQRAYRVSFTVDEMNPKFGYYYISSFFKEYINRHAVEATVKSIRKPMLVKFEVPVPPMEIQQRIVDILDRFDALTTSLSEGLPAELAARRSQYEYYRDQLLTFPRKGENQ